MSRQITEAKASELAEYNEGKSRADWVDSVSKLILKGGFSIHHDECSGYHCTNLDSITYEVVGSASGVESAITAAYLGDTEKLDRLMRDEAVRQLQNLADDYDIGE